MKWLHSSIMKLIIIVIALVSNTLLHTLAQASEILISPELIIASNLTPASSDSGTPGKPAISFDGENFLVVTCREENATAFILGTLVSPDGAILASFPIANILPVFGCQDPVPSVAFDGSNYLVVFGSRQATGSTDIFGARVSPEGVTLDGPEGFRILSFSFRPDVAFDGSNYLVVAERFDNLTSHDIVGAIVSPDGLILNEPQIFVAPGSQYQPAIAFDGITYLVAFSDIRNGQDIYGTRVTSEGIPLDPNGIPISTAVGIQSTPEITFDGNNYFIVWTDERNGPGSFPPILDIYGTRLTPDAVLLDGPADIGGIAINTHPRPQQHPTVSFDGLTYLITWEMSFFLDAPEGIFSARVSTDGSLIDGPPEELGITISEPDTFDSALLWPTSYFNGSKTLLAWVNNRALSGTFKEIVGAFITAVSDTQNVNIDIIPNRDTNTINLNNKGSVQVAILSTAEFHVFNEVNPDSVVFGPADAAAIRYKIKDVNRDGLLDIIFYFKIRETGIECGDTDATLTGETFDGQAIEGTDSIVTKGCGQ